LDKMAILKNKIKLSITYPTLDGSYSTYNHNTFFFFFTYITLFKKMLTNM